MRNFSHQFDTYNINYETMKKYTSKEIEEVLENYRNGVSDKRITDIFYRRIEGAKNTNLSIHYTREEMIEFAKCYKDPFYFFETYCKILTVNGFANVKLRKYQKDLIQAYFDNKFNITAASRQTGMTTVIALISLYNVVFEFEKTNVIMAARRDTAIEKLHRVQEMYINLPFFLKPGITNWNMNRICFDNGCSIRAHGSSQSPVGFQIHRLFIDDYANFPDAAGAVRNIWATISALKDSKLFITSAPNGYNLFHNTFVNAERKEGDPLKNNFVAHRVYWWEVPGRDEEWKQKEINNIGQEAFNQCYDLQFFSAKESTCTSTTPIVVKLEKQVDRSDLMSLGFSRIDGLPIYRFTGGNIDLLGVPYTIIPSIDNFM